MTKAPKPKPEAPPEPVDTWGDEEVADGLLLTLTRSQDGVRPLMVNSLIAQEDRAAMDGRTLAIKVETIRAALKRRMDENWRVHGNRR